MSVAPNNRPNIRTGSRPNNRPRSRAEIAQRMRRSVGRLSTAALQRMDRDMAWFRDLAPQERSWIGMIVQAGIKQFVDWYADPEAGSPELRAGVFGNAPRAFAGQISLHRTVAMVRLSIDVMEENVVDVLGEVDADPVLEAISWYGRELAFATAEVYARAAEMRGAWDARLEALVVDSVLRGEADSATESRASALGWAAEGQVLTLIGRVPDSPEGRAGAVEEGRRVAHEGGWRALCAVQGERLVVIVGGPADAAPPLTALGAVFGTGPVVVGPAVEDLTDVPASAAAALAGFQCASGWPGAPRPVAADDLLPERALGGDQDAIGHLIEEIHRPLAESGPVVRDTVQAYLEAGSSLEGTARALFVHANTVRYRLRRAHEVTGLDPTNARDAYTLRVALTLGRLDAANL